MCHRCLLVEMLQSDPHRVHILDDVLMQQKPRCIHQVSFWAVGRNLFMILCLILNKLSLFVNYMSCSAQLGFLMMFSCKEYCLGSWQLCIVVRNYVFVHNNHVNVTIVPGGPMQYCLCSWQLCLVLSNTVFVHDNNVWS